MKEAFRQAIFDDLNVSAALAAIFRLVRQINYVIARGRLCARHAGEILQALGHADSVLGVLLPREDALAPPPEIARLLREREEARQARDFARADALRAEIVELGYDVEDRPEGTWLRRRS